VVEISQQRLAGPQPNELTSLRHFAVELSDKTQLSPYRGRRNPRLLSTDYPRGETVDRYSTTRDVQRRRRSLQICAAGDTSNYAPIGEAVSELLQSGCVFGAKIATDERIMQVDGHQHCATCKHVARESRSKRGRGISMIDTNLVTASRPGREITRS
jgi:hypothetical protein